MIIQEREEFYKSNCQYKAKSSQIDKLIDQHVQQARAAERKIFQAQTTELEKVKMQLEKQQ